MGLAVVRSLSSVRDAEDLEAFEQELVDQYALSGIGAGLTDGYVGYERSVLFEYLRFLGRPVWTTRAADADRYLAFLRTERKLARHTVQMKAWTLSRFFDFLLARSAGDIHALTGFVIEQPIDEFNRPSNADYDTAVRIPPCDEEVEALFGQWRMSVFNDSRKYLTAARDYVAASLWRRLGLRINETVMLDVGDWQRQLGGFGKLHVRFGKGSRGRGAKPRLVTAINDVDVLLDWWFVEVRHQFGDDWTQPDAPLLPSERRDPTTGMRARAGDDTLRRALETAVASWLPTWSGRLTPHVLRHYCASSLYGHGLDLKAIQDILGHEWLSTTTRYIHVHDDHVERAWIESNERVGHRLAGQGA